MSIENGIIGLKLTTSRMLTKGVNGQFEWDLTPESEGVSLACSSSNADSKEECTGEIHVGLVGWFSS